MVLVNVTGGTISVSNYMEWASTTLRNISPMNGNRREGGSMAEQAISKVELGLMQVLSGLHGTVDRTSPGIQCQCQGQAIKRLLRQSLSVERFLVKLF